MPPGLTVLLTAVLGALPPPPTQVVLTGHGTFGEIHFDHVAHLARRISCKSCHGPGPVHRPELTPGVAHATCRACHVEIKRGPTSCRDCHQNVKESGVAVAAASTPTSTSTPAGTPTATATGSPTAIAIAPRPGAGSPGLPLTAAPDDVLRRTVRAGASVIGGSGRAGSGLSIVAGLEQGRWAVESEVDWTNRTGSERTLALVGGGIVEPLGRTLRVRAVGLCGIDSGSPAYLLPAVGARAGLEWRRRGTRFTSLPALDVSVAVVRALGDRVDAAGRSGAETAAVLSLLLGWELPVR